MKKMLDQMRRLSPLSLPLCFLSFVFLDFSFRYFYQFISTEELFSWDSALFTLGWSLLFTSLIALLPRLGRRIVMMVLIVFFSILTIVHAAMFNIFGHFFTFSDMSFAGDGAKFFSWSYLNFRKAFLLCVIFSILLMALAAFLAQKKGPWKKQWKLHLAALGLAAVSIIPIAWVNYSLSPKADSMWFGNTFDPNSRTEVYKEFTDTNRSLMMTGLYQYSFRNFAVSFGIGADHQSIDRLDEYYDRRASEISGDNEKTGVFKDKNLVMVMLESIDTWLLTEDYMPNLYALQQEGTNFTNHYAPLYLSAATFNTEIISQTGLVPAMSGLNSSAYSTNSFPLSLANAFEDAGYVSNSFHPASPDIYSRGSVHRNLGFESYHNCTDMGMDDYQLDSQMIRGYGQMVQDSPFYSFIITYSGHGPYTEEMKNISDPHLSAAKAAVAKSGVTGSEDNMSQYTLAVAHAMETDQFIGELVDKLEADGKLDDTVLLFYADHYGKYLTDAEFLKEIKDVGSSETELYHTPAFFYAKGQKAEEITKYTATPDLVPTVVNLFGLDVDRRYYVGDDIFGDQGGVVMFPNYAWFDGATYSGSDTGEGTEAINARTAEVRERINASYDTLKSNYFSSWNK